jgi:hypothetical protein
MGRKRGTPTEPVRIASYNASRLWSLAGRLQDKAGRRITLDDAIDCLFDCKERLEAIEKKDNKNES